MVTKNIVRNILKMDAINDLNCITPTRFYHKSSSSQPNFRKVVYPLERTAKLEILPLECITAVRKGLK